LKRVSQRNNNKIRQHEKTNQSFNSSSPSPLSNPFFPQTIAIAIAYTVYPDDQQQSMLPALSPPPPATGGGGGSSVKP
jgi:hypothetical protein